jgi:protein TonB
VHYQRAPKDESVEFSIDRRGAVQRAQALAAKPPNIFDAAAIKALRQWRYNPKVVDGQPVKKPG